MTFTFNSEKEYKYWETVIKYENKELFDKVTDMEQGERRDELMSYYKAGQELYANLIGEHMEFVKTTASNENKKFVTKAIGILGSKLFKNSEEA